MRFFFVLMVMALSASSSQAGSLWVNNITVGEHGMTWSYTETLTGVESMLYRIDIDTRLGNNDSFVNAWELLEADKEKRRLLKSEIDNEMDVRLDNSSSDVEVVDIESTLSSDAIGKTHAMGTIVNRYNVTYRFRDSIFNVSSIWFLGQAMTPVTIIMPQDIDVANVSGMDNVTEAVTSHTEISGNFSRLSEERGEITLLLLRNASPRQADASVTGNATGAVNENATESFKAALPLIRYISLGFVGVLVVVLVYIFRVRKS